LIDLRSNLRDLEIELLTYWDFILRCNK
jgi:hypothetical protein